MEERNPRVTIASAETCDARRKRRFLSSKVFLVEPPVLDVIS